MTEQQTPPGFPGYRFRCWGTSGSPKGWRGAAFLCPQCGDLFLRGGGPRDDEGRPYGQSCSCGCLHEDPAAGRFSCCAGDDAVAVYDRDE